VQLVAVDADKDDVHQEDDRKGGEGEDVEGAEADEGELG
jgi:hypothetical protein